MILVTGGTGFVGKALVRQLTETGRDVRILIRPSPRSPGLPFGVPVDVAVSSLEDELGLRAAMVGVDVVYHLAGVERRGAYGNLMRVDIQGSRAITQAAVDAGVDRIFYVSHLGADRASAYPVAKAKGIAEEFIRRCGVDYTILRSAIVYGPNDGFTTGLAHLLSVLPFVFLIPGDGSTLLQPLWVEDLATCLTWALDDDRTRDQVYDIGGPEFLTLKQVINLVMQTVGIRRAVLSTRPTYLRWITVLMEALFPGFPVSIYWLDYLATNRTCALDTIPRIFNLMPARMSQRIHYLRGEDWQGSLLRSMLQRRKAMR
jgi:NADH dehydrogenase